MSREKGSALITVLLVVLVLTMVGLAAALYMSMEDRTSQNAKLAQTALHAAQAGLRQGELIISKTVTNSLLNNALDPATHSNYAGNDEPTSQADLLGTTHLGTVLFDAMSGGNAQYNVYVGSTLTAGYKERYSLFIRNDPNDYDPTNAAQKDKFWMDGGNGRINLISRGSVLDSNGREAAVKILTEQIYFGLASVKPGQFRFGQLGTSATQY